MNRKFFLFLLLLLVFSLLSVRAPAGTVEEILKAYDPNRAYPGLEIIHPFNGTLFPGHGSAGILLEGCIRGGALAGHSGLREPGCPDCNPDRHTQLSSGEKSPGGYKKPFSGSQGRGLHPGSHPGRSPANRFKGSFSFRHLEGCG